MSDFAPFAAAVADWLGTFALHSTCALGLAWIVSRSLAHRATALQERLLRLAIWAPLVSSLAQQFGWGTASLEWTDAPLSQHLASLPAPSVDAAAATAAAPGAAIAIDWAQLACGVAMLAALSGLHWLWRSQRRLAAVLRTREPVVDGRVLTTAARAARSLGMRRTPHLSCSPALATPIAFGWLRPEICLPDRAGRLADAPLQAMLAHELAHLRRADPAWMWFVAAVQACLPWQPLLWLVRARWARLVELRCDAVAAQHSSPEAVARCLLDVAEWLRPRASVPVVALGMAARPSSLRERIDAALRGPEADRGSPLGSVLCAGAALGALTLGVPGVARADADMRLPSVVAPEAAPSRSASLPAALAALDHDYAELLAEVAAFRESTAAAPPTPESLRLERQLDLRLRALARVRERLHRAAGAPDTPSVTSR